MATFINKLMLMESQDFPLIKPKFTPNGRPLDRKKRNKRSVSLPDKLPSSVPLCMLQKPKSVTYKSELSKPAIVVASYTAACTHSSELRDPKNLTRSVYIILYGAVWHRDNMVMVMVLHGDRWCMIML
jgi:hypothetical protein